MYREEQYFRIFLQWNLSLILIITACQNSTIYIHMEFLTQNNQLSMHENIPNMLTTMKYNIMTHLPGW